jgi:hypothetical protein
MSDKGHSAKSSSGDDIDVDDDDQLAGGENVSPTRTVLSYPIPYDSGPRSTRAFRLSSDILGTGESSSWTQSRGS